jgi:hypothetical protein
MINEGIGHKHIFKKYGEHRVQDSVRCFFRRKKFDFLWIGSNLVLAPQALRAVKTHKTIETIDLEFLKLKIG